MALGLRSAWRTSLSFTPAKLNEIEREKKAIPKDMANRGWRATATTGPTTTPAHSRRRSNHVSPTEEICPPDLAADARRKLSIPLVATRMFSSKLAGGSTGSRDKPSFAGFSFRHEGSTRYT